MTSQRILSCLLLSRLCFAKFRDSRSKALSSSWWETMPGARFKCRHLDLFDKFLLIAAQLLMKARLLPSGQLLFFISLRALGLC